MLHPLNVTLAQTHGIRTSLVAQCLWDHLCGRCMLTPELFDGTRWIRMGQKALTITMPYLTHHTARTELNRLEALGIIRSKVQNDSPFDHTKWYTFTEYGCDILAATETLGDAQ